MDCCQEYPQEITQLLAICCVWYEDVGDNLEWHLGIVDSIQKTIFIYLTWKGQYKNGYNWLLPEEAEIHLTNPSQIIARHIEVAYSATLLGVK